jgi:hypothetical protein
MATLKPSAVAVRMDQLAESIAQMRDRLTAAKGSISAQATRLGNLPTEFADLVSTVNDPAYGTGAFETLAQDQLLKLTAEFQALKSHAEQAETALSGTTEF